MARLPFGAAAPASASLPCRIQARFAFSLARKHWGLAPAIHISVFVDGAWLGCRWGCRPGFRLPALLISGAVCVFAGAKTVGFDSPIGWRSWVAEHFFKRDRAGKANYDASPCGAISIFDLLKMPIINRVRPKMANGIIATVQINENAMESESWVASMPRSLFAASVKTRTIPNTVGTIAKIMETAIIPNPVLISAGRDIINSLVGSPQHSSQFIPGTSANALRYRRSGNGALQNSRFEDLGQAAGHRTGRRP